MAALPTGPLPAGPWAEPDLFGEVVTYEAIYAAPLAKPRVGSARYSAIAAIARAGMAGLTDMELRDIGIQSKRRLELVSTGWVEDSGLRRPGPTGRPAIAWRLTQRGHDKWMST